MNRLKTWLTYRYFRGMLEANNQGPVFSITPESCPMSPMAGYIFFKGLRVKVSKVNDLVLPEKFRPEDKDVFAKMFDQHPSLAIVVAAGKRFKNEPMEVKPYSIVTMNTEQRYELILVNNGKKKEVLSMAPARCVTSVYTVSWRKLLAFEFGQLLEKIFKAVKK